MSPLPLNSHERSNAWADHAMREIGAALARCVSWGMPWHAVHWAALAQLDAFRVSHMDPADRDAQFAHPTARMGDAELRELVARRIGEGWPADGKSLASPPTFPPLPLTGGGTAP